MRLLLGSGGIRTESRLRAWLDEFDQFLGPIRRVVFVPYALADHDGYVKSLTERGFAAGRELLGIHTLGDPQAAIESADAIFVGGGNTFRLLADLYRHDLLGRIRRRVAEGMPYIGVSAGTNVAGPSMKTTNDMPITQPPSFDALGLVGFQINPHYFAGAIHYETAAGMLPYAGETRDDRLREFHEMNDAPILALWEGAILRVEHRTAELKGPEPAKLFLKGEAPRDLAPGSDVSFLLENSPAV